MSYCNQRVRDLLMGIDYFGLQKKHLYCLPQCDCDLSLSLSPSLFFYLFSFFLLVTVFLIIHETVYSFKDSSSQQPFDLKYSTFLLDNLNPLILEFPQCNPPNKPFKQPQKYQSFLLPEKSMQAVCFNKQGSSPFCPHLFQT